MQNAAPVTQQKKNSAYRSDLREVEVNSVGEFWWVFLCFLCGLGFFLVGFFIQVFLFVFLYCCGVLGGVFGLGFVVLFLFLLVIFISIPTLVSLMLFLPAGKKKNNKVGFGMHKSHRIHMIVFY